MPKKERDETEAKIAKAVLDVLEGRTAVFVSAKGPTGMFSLSFCPRIVSTLVHEVRYASEPATDTEWQDDGMQEDVFTDTPENPDDVVGEEDLAPDERTSDIDVVPL